MVEVLQWGLAQGLGWRQCINLYHLQTVFLPMGTYWGEVPIRESWVKLPEGADDLASLRRRGWIDYPP